VLIQPAPCRAVIPPVPVIVPHAIGFQAPTFMMLKATRPVAASRWTGRSLEVSPGVYRTDEDRGRDGQRAGTWGVLLALLAIVISPAVSEGPEADAARLERVQYEIARLETELENMAGQERGLIGELDRLGAELTLREREYEQVSLELAGLGTAIEVHDGTLSGLEDAQAERRGYLAFRLREIYKSGSEDWLRMVVEGESVEAYWNALDYASYLSERDREVLGALRHDEEAVESERRTLEQARARLAEAERELGQSQARLATARKQRAGALSRLREDQASHRGALVELELAAEQLTALVSSLPQDGGRVGLDIHKFKGLLEWPAEGSLGAGFGTQVHPRFKTEVPHPGWDIDARTGSKIRAVFDGEVVYSSWMRGYGLTTIVDHGHAVLSIYAHAAVLLESQGERVIRGQVLGLVGETGSLRGPYLYFELRDGGEPSDPAEWLRRR
jgi:septal ring factor EnvC (AmiA/AmiB activator)